MPTIQSSLIVSSTLTSPTCCFLLVSPYTCPSSPSSHLYYRTQPSYTHVSYEAPITSLPLSKHLAYKVTVLALQLPRALPSVVLERSSLPTDPDFCHCVPLFLSKRRLTIESGSRRISSFPLAGDSDGRGVEC
jgi:hypothetical protein